jgi:predicted amidohydrolase YtcJ
MQNFIRGTKADIVLKGGKVLTVDDQNSVHSAVAIAGNKILACGTDADMESLTDDTTKVIDLHGKTVMPGVYDSHNHVPAAGVLLDGVMLFGVDTIDGVKERVKEKVDRTPKGEWVLGGGWIESQFQEYRMPTRWDLDEVSPDNPVLLNRLFARTVVNSKALELAGITKDSPPPARGTIDRDPETGEPTGVLRDGAQSLVRDIIPTGTPEEHIAKIEYYMKTAMKEYLGYGITGILDPGVDVPTMRTYRKLHKEGNLPIRLNMMPDCYGLRSYDPEFTEGLLKYTGIDSGFGDEWLNLGALKIAIDGGVGSKTAMMHEPWLDGSVTDIPLRLDLDVMNDLILRGHRMGWSTGVHTCGDRAQDIAVDAFVAAQKKFPRSDMRHNIIHGYLPSKHSLDMMKEYGIAVSVQPGFMYVEGDIYFDVLSQKQIDYFKPLKTYLDYGIIVAANSDMTSAHYNPFIGMYAAVARKTSQGRSLGDAEKVSREDMLRMFTINGAYLGYMDHFTGSIEPGKLADLAVISDDIYTCPEESIKDIQVMMTISDGKIVFERS